MCTWKNPADCRLLFPCWKDFRLRGSSRTRVYPPSRESLLVALIHWAKSTGIGEKSFELGKHFSKGPSCKPSTSVAVIKSSVPYFCVARSAVIVSISPFSPLNPVTWTSIPLGVSKSSLPFLSFYLSVKSELIELQSVDEVSKQVSASAYEKCLVHARNLVAGTCRIDDTVSRQWGGSVCDRTQRRLRSEYSVYFS